MPDYRRFLIRTSAFLRKEIVEVLRQPLLVLTLVLGPFLILLFFGIGYRNEARPLRTIFVVKDGSPMAVAIERYATTLGPQLIYVGVTPNLAEALERLHRGEIDLITEVPSNPYQTIQGNRQAIFRLYHREIDPLQADYISVFGRVYVDEVNRRVLKFITTEGQVDVTNAQKKLDAAQASAAALRRLLERCAAALAGPGNQAPCNSETVRQSAQDLDHKVDELEIAAGDSLTLIDSVEQGLAQATHPNVGNRPSLAKVIQNTNLLDEIGTTVDDYVAKLKTLAQLEADLKAIEARLSEFLGIDPNILISPFRSEVNNIGAVQTNVTGFFGPAVIVLLLQHLAVTFAALSMVREQQLGAMELFYVAPLSALETLLGKYLSYLIFGSFLAAVLILLVVVGLGAPLLGAWWGMVLVLAALLFSSLGIGFIISLVSRTDTQAVQYSMIVLLTSVFFSGFILSLDALWQPVRLISWMLPATYGILMLRDIMLRGDPPVWGLLFQLILIGAGLFAAAWFLLRRSMGSG